MVQQDPLEQMTELALAQVADAPNAGDAIKIGEAFADETRAALQSWLDAEDVATEPAQSLTSVYRERFGRGEKLETALSEAVERVRAAAYARFNRTAIPPRR